MSEFYDAIVVGAGHNSLTASAYLAKAGLSVCVLEKNSVVGGGATSREITAPGFVHDTHATAILQAMANPMIKNDELELQSRFGLKMLAPELTYASLFEDETWIGGYISLDHTCESIAKFSLKDAETYKAFAERTFQMSPIFIQGMFKPPIPGDKMVAMLGQTEGGREILDLTNRSLHDYVVETFEHPKVRMHFIKWVSENMSHPGIPGTARDLYLLTSVAHGQDQSLVVGGTQELSNSLVRCIEHHGGTVRTETWVKRVVMNSGRATGVELADGEVLTARKCVVASIHPYFLGDFIEGLDADMLEEARNQPQSSFGAVNSHWALHEAPNYKCSEVNQALLVETLPGDVDQLIADFDDCREGKLPSHFYAAVTHHSKHDSTRAPAGKHALYLYCHVPLDLRHSGPLGRGPVSGWSDEIRDEYKTRMIQDYARYCTNMGSANIIASAAHSPKDMAEWSPSFHRGDIFGVSNLSPMGKRPTARLAQYAVPGAEGVYLAGPFCHPGGGITGGGRGTAIKVLMDCGIDVRSVAKI